MASAPEGSKRKRQALRLRRFRDSLQITQRQLATELGVARGAVSYWESGQRSVPGPVLKLIEIYESELGRAPGTLDKLDTRWISRNLRLAAAAAEIAGAYSGRSLRSLFRGDTDGGAGFVNEAQAHMARRLTETLGELKGPVMKLGQLASYLDFAIPSHAQRLLAPLQRHSTPMHPDVIESTLRNELGRPPSEIFGEWSRTPISAASIGQVHWATLKDGRQAAVKVQYPGIADAIRADVANSRAMERIGAIFFPRQPKGEFARELEERLAGECDYLEEARSQEMFRKRFEDDADIVVPEVFSEHCTSRVLVSRFATALPFQQFVATSTQKQKDKAGLTIFRFFMESLFSLGRFNADPHPGNYLFEGDRVVFVDFGCVKRLSPEFVARWKLYLRALAGDDRAAASRLLVEMGIAPAGRRFDFDHHYSVMRELYRPWLRDEEFAFSREYVETLWRAMVPENPNLRDMTLPREWIALNRLQWGLYSVLSSLGARGRWSGVVAPLLA
jgi:predicted unusual protein kinase regulating ubiquinone biosynthesis (AarF/ABC1/UbiB family)/DNA-binding XRE family transcriptional regulator